MLVEREGFEPPKLSQLIYSQSHLAALEPLHAIHFAPDPASHAFRRIDVASRCTNVAGADGRI